MSYRLNAGTIRIRHPVPEMPSASGAPAFTLDRTIRGLRVGLRYDTWRSWTLICQVWAELLRRDGAEPVLLYTGGRTGAEGEKTRADIAAWVKQVDCAVSGIGT